jgi:hypothetical protein
VAFDVDYVGEWHKHPIGLGIPSSGDIAEAQSILRSGDYHLPSGEILLPIATVDAFGRFALRTFTVCRGELAPLEPPYYCLSDADVQQLLRESADVLPAVALAQRRVTIDRPSFSAAHPTERALPPTNHELSVVIPSAVSAGKNGKRAESPLSAEIDALADPLLAILEVCTRIAGNLVLFTQLADAPGSRRLA